MLGGIKMANDKHSFGYISMTMIDKEDYLW